MADVTMPQLGETVADGTVTKWLKKVGETVTRGEPLFEVSTDKVDTEIPSPVAGVIEAILVQEDETVEVGTALVTIGDGSGAGAPAEAPVVATEVPANSPPATQVAPEPEAAPEPAPAPAAEESPAEPEPVTAPEPVAAPEPVVAPEPVIAPEPTPEPQPPVASVPAPAAEATPVVAAAPAVAAPTSAAPAVGVNAGYVTPIVRKLAHEQGVELSTISGTGVGGRIRKQDVLDAVAAPAAVAAGSITPTVVPIEASPLRGTTVPMSRLRKVVAERAVVSMQTMAQLTTVVEIDVTKVAAYRDRVKADFLATTGVKLNFLPFFTLAAAEALRAFPIVNATVDGDSIVYPDHENISIAVDTERGLLTPVIRNAGDLDLAGIAHQIADLAERTRDNKLKPDELAGGTFTVTNTGSRGALFDTPVVFLPQVAILGTGIVSKKAVVVSDGGFDAIAIRSTVYFALSYDHRIVDGADAARFLTTVKSRLENGDFSDKLGI